MTEYSVVIAGFGGQGILFAGRLLAGAALQQGWEVTWIPSYGPEMRGGTANCTVVLAREPVGSPLVQKPWAVLALNAPSLSRYAPQVQPCGFLVINSSLCPTLPDRHDLTLIPVPANDVALAAGHAQTANVVMLAALVQASALLPLSALADALEAALAERARPLLPANRQALRRGAEFGIVRAAAGVQP